MIFLSNLLGTMSDYDRRPGTTKTAGKSFKLHFEKLQKGLGEAHEATRLADGLINYRLYDRSGRNDFMTNEEVLDEQQRKEAQKAAKTLASIQKAIEAATIQLRDFERTSKWLDDNLGFN